MCVKQDLWQLEKYHLELKPGEPGGVQQLHPLEATSLVHVSCVTGKVETVNIMQCNI